MEKEFETVGFSFAPEGGNFCDVYATENEAREAAVAAYSSGRTDLLGADPQTGGPRKSVHIIRVWRIVKEGVICNAVTKLLEYVMRTYDGFLAGTGDAKVIYDPDLLNHAVPVLDRDIDFGGPLVRGEFMYVYNF